MTYQPCGAMPMLGDSSDITLLPFSDRTDSLSNTGLNVVPPLIDFQTPPLAAPTYTVNRPFSFTAAIAATRPLIAADPMFRAPRPEIVSESNLASWAFAPTAKTSEAANNVNAVPKQRIDLCIAAVSLVVL